MRRGSVTAPEPDMNSATTNSSNDVMKAKRAPARTPGRISGSVTWKKVPVGVAPRLSAACASLAGIDPRLEQAALSLGATPTGTFFQVTLPLIRPGVLAGALFAFITSFDELVVALFISGSGAVTLPRRMWDDLLYQIEPTIAAVSTLTIVLSVALMGCAHMLRKRAPT